MMHNVLTGLEKSAILLMCLGEDAAAQVFRELSDTQVSKISKTMASINHIPSEVRQQVLDQYREEQERFSGDFFKGNEFAKTSIYATDSGERTQALLNRHIAETESRPFASLADMKPQVAADLLENQHPQIIALIISTQPSDQGAEIISCLPESLRADIIERIARLESVSDKAFQDLEDIFSREIERNHTHELKPIKGFNRAVDFLNKMSSGLNTSILESLEETDDDLAEKMRRQMFSFESLKNLDDQSLQLLLREISNESLGIALQNCSDDLRSRIFSNMSSRAVAMIRDDLESMGQVSASEVKAVQQSIVKTAIRLKEAGAFMPTRQAAYER